MSKKVKGKRRKEKTSYYVSVAAFFTFLLLPFSFYLLLFALPTPTEAFTERNISGNLITEISPDNPGARAAVSVTLVSYSIDINRSIVSWSVNGVSRLSGVGEKRFNFDLGAAGVATTLEVRALAPDGAEHAKQITFIPGTIDLLWEAESTVPPTYRGKALITPGVDALFTAIPTITDNTGKRLAPNQLYYEWSRDYEVLQALSGYGKETALFGGFGTLKDTIIGVAVKHLESGNAVEATMPVRARAPLLLFYEESPLAGTRYERALDSSWSLPSNEVVLRAEPYHLSKRLRPTFTWSVDGVSAQADPTNPRLITLRQERPGAGEVELACVAESGGGSVRRAVKVLFGGGGFSF